MASHQLNLAHQGLAATFGTIVGAYKTSHPGRDVVILCTYRTPGEQFELYQHGREQIDGRWELVDPLKRLTNVDGISTHGPHNILPSRAIDFGITVHGKLVWDPAEYQPFGDLAVKAGLIWGGSWTGFPDFDHVEWKE